MKGKDGTKKYGRHIAGQKQFSWKSTSEGYALTSREPKFLLLLIKKAQSLLSAQLHYISKLKRVKILLVGVTLMPPLLQMPAYVAYIKQTGSAKLL